MAILFILVAPFARLSFTADTYMTMYLFFAGLTIAFYIIRNIVDVRIARHDSQSIPDVKTQLYLPVLRTSLLLLCGFICAFFYFEIWKRFTTRAVIPELVLVELVTLLFSAFLIYRAYRYLNPRQQVCVGSPITNIRSFLTWGVRFFTGNFWGYIVIGVILNGSIALIVLLAENKTLDINLTQANGFILFIVFAFGNLLLFALVALKLDRIGKEPMTEEGTVVPVIPGTPQKYLNPKMSTFMMGAFMIGFLVVFFAVPMLTLESRLVGGKTTEKDILLTVGQPDPSQVIINYNGGKDAAQFVGMTAIVEVYVKKFGKGSGYETIASGDLGSKTSKNPITIGNKIVLTGSFPEGSRVIVWGYFSDGKYQTLIDQQL